jgi:hypothetical protein
MKVRHGYMFISKIAKDDADILKESWEEYATNTPSEKDRAKNITYNIQEIGKIVISHSNGTVIIFTNYNMPYVENFFCKQVTANSKIIFKDNLRCAEVGHHFSKSHGTMPFAIETPEAAVIPVWISVRSCNNYADFHIKLMTDKATIKFPSNKEVGSENATSSPNRHYLSDKEILDFLKERGSVKTSDCKELGIDRTTFYRRLEKMSKKYPEIKRTNGYPAIYLYAG